ncbi:NNT [Symbiodinium sp. CCMP2592]|nr:NNT [Symbiodinium sp. CCMP2592]
MFTASMNRMAPAPVRRLLLQMSGPPRCRAKEASEQRWLPLRYPLAAAIIAGTSSVSVLRCEPTEQRRPVGRWRLEKAQSESMRPYFAGLGLPGFVARIIDHVPVELHISVEDKILKVVDRTLFGENCTTIELGGAEVEKETRNKRKKFMLSAFEDLSEGTSQLTVKCRLFQRGDGWYSLQSFAVLPEGSLRECYTLKRPGAEDVVVTRVFSSLDGNVFARKEPRQKICPRGWWR